MHRRALVAPVEREVAAHAAHHRVIQVDAAALVCLVVGEQVVFQLGLHRPRLTAREGDGATFAGAVGGKQRVVHQDVVLRVNRAALRPRIVYERAVGKLHKEDVVVLLGVAVVRAARPNCSVAGEVVAGGKDGAHLLRADGGGAVQGKQVVVHVQLHERVRVDAVVPVKVEGAPRDVEQVVAVSQAQRFLCHVREAVKRDLGIALPLVHVHGLPVRGAERVVE
mmetsp:Transcript_42225/g.106506  ORF Transcript_42225/g.106506 Transcript_42225/m.106506 type:complete len:223 (+) Transcript_42225:642-1310(+)